MSLSQSYTIKAGMSLDFGHTPPPTTKLAGLERLQIDVQNCDYSSAFIFDWIFFILAGNEDNHKSFDEFEFCPALTWVYDVSCPRASGIITIDFNGRKCCCHSSTFIFDLIFFILIGNKDMHKSLDEFEFRSDPTTDYGVSCPLVSENIVSPGFSSILIQIFLIFAYNQTWHNILCLNLGLFTVSSSELPAFEHSKIWCLRTLCWLSGEQSLPIGLLVVFPTEQKGLAIAVIQQIIFHYHFR